MYAFHDVLGLIRRYFNWIISDSQFNIGKAFTLNLFDILNLVFILYSSLCFFDDPLIEGRLFIKTVFILPFLSPNVALAYNLFYFFTSQR